MAYIPKMRDTKFEDYCGCPHSFLFFYYPCCTNCWRSQLLWKTEMMTAYCWLNCSLPLSLSLTKCFAFFPLYTDNRAGRLMPLVSPFVCNRETWGLGRLATGPSPRNYQVPKWPPNWYLHLVILLETAGVPGCSSSSSSTACCSSEHVRAPPPPGNPCIFC